MRFASTFIVSTKVFTASASSTIDCSRGDAQCVSLLGAASGSYCTYWQATPVCHGSSTPCNCDGTLPVVPTDEDALTTFAPADTEGIANPLAVVQPTQAPQRRRRVFVVNNTQPQTEAPVVPSTSQSSDPVAPANPQPQRQRRVFPVRGTSTNPSNGVSNSVPRQSVAPVIHSLPQVAIPEGLSPEIAGVRTSIEQFVARQISDQAMFNQVLDRIERLTAELRGSSSSSSTFDELFDQLGGNRLLDFISAQSSSRSAGLLQNSPEAIIMVLGSVITDALPQSQIAERIQQDICTSKIEFLRQIIRTSAAPSGILSGSSIYRSTFAAGWARVCPTLHEDDVAIARSIMLHGVRRHQGMTCSSIGCRQMGISTTRDTLLEDAFGLMGTAGPISPRLLGQLLSGVQSASLGETGHGPGVIREWFTVLAEKLFNGFEFGIYERSFSAPYYSKISSMLRISEPTTFKSWYKMSGRFMALSIIQNIPVGNDFPLYYYAILTDQPVRLQDIQEDEPELHKSLSDILAMDAETLESIGVALEGSGYEDELTVDNRMEQINGRLSRMIQAPTDVREEMEALKEGFFEVLPREIFRGFTPQQMRKFLVGEENVDVVDLGNNIKFRDGYTRRSQQIVWFLEVLEEMPQDQRRRVLRFITGSSRVPLGGFRNLQPSTMEITYYGYATDMHMPKTHTCFNQIELPPYTTKEALRQKLIQALDSNPDMTMHIA